VLYCPGSAAADFPVESVGEIRSIRQVSDNKNLVGPASNNNHSVGQASRLSDYTWMRHLPHYQLSSGYYFITFTTYNRLTLPPLQKDCVFNAIRFFDTQKYDLHASVVLDDHAHMVVTPLDALPKIMHSIKSFTAHQINKSLNRSGKVWQDESYDRVIRDEKEYVKTLNYIANNPISKNMVKIPEEYKWLYILGWIETNKL
jgi:REP element-mobilizing transposase RayT